MPIAGIHNASRAAGVAFACLVFWATSAGAQQLSFTHYTPDGDRVPLPSAEVHKVHQDRLGYMWMVVYSSGLMRYDGHEAETYTTEDGLRDLGVWDVVEDAAGRMWVASNAGLVVSEKPLHAYVGAERIRFVDTIRGISLVNTLVGKNMTTVDTEGRVWVGTGNSGVVRYHLADEFNVDTLSMAAGNEANPAVRSLVARRDGSVWVGMRDGQLFIFDNGKDVYRVLDATHGVPDEDIRTLYESPTGVLYLGTGGGAVYEVDAAREGVSFRMLTRVLQGSVYDISVTFDGTMWIATQGAGLVVVDSGSTTRHYSRRNGLLSDHIFDVTQDREGNLWFAQLGGVSKLRLDFAAFSGYTSVSVAGEAPVLPAPAVGAVEVAVDRNDPCMFWAGTQVGVACIHGDGTSTIIGRNDGLESEWVNGLSRDAAGRLWIGTLKGVYCLSDAAQSPPAGGKTVGRSSIGGRRMLLTAYGGPPVLSVARATLSAEAIGDIRESLWFVGNRELVAFIDNTWLVFKQAAGLPATVLHAVEVDSDGYVWVGTRDHGLFRSRSPLTIEALSGFERHLVRHDGRAAEHREVVAPIFEQIWTVSNGAPSNEVYDVFADDEGLWIGTAEGLILMSTSSFEVLAHLTQKDGLKAANVMSLSPTPQSDRLWVGTNGGLAEIDPTTRMVVRTITKQDGLLDNEVWFLGSVRVGIDGTVYYGTAHGVAVYRPDVHVRNEVPPVLRIREASLIHLTNGRNELVVQYSGLSFSDEKRVVYRTRLKGYDADWSPEKKDFKTRYTNLPALFFPKEYRFDVMAANSDGVWTERPMSYVFTVRPAWWFQWWAFTVYSIVLAVVVVAFIRYQRSRLIRIEREKASRREAQLKLEAALARFATAEAEAKTLYAENERKEIELQKASQLKAAYDELQSMQEQLIQAEKLASLGEFTAGIAHEMKNPLNFINNFAELTAELLDELREYVSEASTSAGFSRWDEVDALLHDLRLNTAKISIHGARADGIVRSMLSHSGGYSGRRELVNVNELVDDILDVVVESVNDSESDIVFERDYDENIGAASVITQEFGRVLTNLISNAVYAATEHHKTSGTPSRITLSTRGSNGSVQIAVGDNGPGIPSDIRTRIFEPFFTTKPTGTGTGLGLSLCYSIVTKSYGGTIEVVSTVGKGATFIISIPRSPQPIAAEIAGPCDVVEHQQ